MRGWFMFLVKGIYERLMCELCFINEAFKSVLWEWIYVLYAPKRIYEIITHQVFGLCVKFSFPRLPSVKTKLRRVRKVAMQWDVSRAFKVEEATVGIWRPSLTFVLSVIVKHPCNMYIWNMFLSLSSLVKKWSWN